MDKRQKRETVRSLLALLREDAEAQEALDAAGEAKEEARAAKRHLDEFALRFAAWRERAEAALADLLAASEELRRDVDALKGRVDERP